MSDKKPKLWEATFGDSADQKDTSSVTDSTTPETSAEYSRVQRNETQKSNKVLVWSLVIVLLAIMCLPIVWSAVSAGHQKTAVDSTSQVAVSSKPKSTATHKKAKKQKAKKVASHLNQSTNKKSESPSDKTAKETTTTQPDTNTQQDQTNNAAATDNNNAEQANTNQQATPAASSSATNSSYYVVQAHDNAYRIALNHGMTTQQLYQLNGMSSNTVLRPGMRLRVH